MTIPTDDKERAKYLRENLGWLLVMEEPGAVWCEIRDQNAPVRSLVPVIATKIKKT